MLTVAAVSPLGVLAAALSMVIKKPGSDRVGLERDRADFRRGVHPALDAAGLAAGRRVVPADHPRAQRLPRRGRRRPDRGGRGTTPLWLLVASVVLMPFSLWLFARAVNKARVDGTLAMY